MPLGRPKHGERQAMRASGVLTCAATIAAAVTAVVGTSSLAQASDDWGLNGTYTATSNGEWARTNERFQDEGTVRSTWTITTTCSYPTECTGTVTSDQGWSADIYKKSNLWYVKRIVKNWEPCADGPAFDGLEVYFFWEAGPDAYVVPGSTTLVGEDQTTGPSGACGLNQPLQIRMPFKLVKVA
jgi:hypothetical protein